MHGAYLAYTQGDAHENPKPEKGGGKRPGEEKTVGGEEKAVRGGKTQGRNPLQR